ncbi:hypothetical protein ELBR111191_04900 [Elizabethkingia bruuniana]
MADSECVLKMGIVETIIVVQQQEGADQYQVRAQIPIIV